MCALYAIVKDANSLKDISNNLKVEILAVGEVEQMGVTKEQIRTDIELKLRLAGIKFSEVGTNMKPPDVILAASIIVGCNNIGACFAHVNLSLRQMVTMWRDPATITAGVTWNEGWTAITSQAMISTETRNALKDQMDSFINDYLYVNPKKEQP